jgi:hypothetical protein
VGKCWIVPQNSIRLVRDEARFWFGMTDAIDSGESLSLLTKEVSRLANNPYRRGLVRPSYPTPCVRDSFSSWSKSVRALISLFTILLVSQATNAQSKPLNLHGILNENAAFDVTDFEELHRGEPVVTRLPPHHKQEVAVYGLVRVQAPAEVFLQSFRDTIATKSNPAILEIGRFGTVPTLEDLKSLTMESRDIEDLRKCVVGNCELKLSAKMIEQFQKTLDWQSIDHPGQATHLFKLMLLEYVQDYLKRGDTALIEYSDKPKTMSLLNGQGALLASLPSPFNQSTQNGNSFSAQGLLPIENAIVWSKIKLGLKPVLAINHIVIFKSEQRLGPQILVLSKQIYANHYFDASIALTGLTRNSAGEHYLFYENHSFADGLQGLFSGIKRKLIEREAVEGLKNVMRATRLRLDARALNQSESGRPPEASSSWIRPRIPRKQVLFLLVCLTALVMLALASYRWKANIPPGTQAG